MKCNKILFTFLMVLLPALTIFSQKATKAKTPIPINNILSVEQFNEIRDYVFANGDRQDYCENSVNAPHLKIKNTDIDLYFMNFSQDKDMMKKADYNVMYLISKLNDGLFNYYIYTTHEGEIFFYDFMGVLRSESVEKDVLSKLQDKIPLVLKAVTKN